ncbi:hypothetical protein M408DRAFT_272344 [Serendipita vermifera MAFF 305830]|uniref:Uncharacterized protein n=1 Tax=Serendipita vermifera MAFF 305830 TaxID=933852 RepID=A0A0C2WXP9_SERVB|nr:hypothetical protein M408DRAFT_272344 [Serendipita vermifera MAFF 305830]
MSTITGPATKVEQIILLGMAVAISAQYSFFLDNLKTGDAFMVALRRYAISSQRQAVAFAVKDIVVTMPSRLDKDTHEEWEKKTLQVLMHIACNNLLEPE